ncbi:hypothetical protein, partial [Vibrio vulnificus]|uniref:hypothetical protein n=1 Tax=Vibrio vulnificus TaxID=672 RepID=UPI0019D46F74
LRRLMGVADQIVASRFSSIDLSNKAYSELKIRVNGEVNKQGFMAFFDRYYPYWLKKKSKLKELPTVASLEALGFTFWVN